MNDIEFTAVGIDNNDWPAMRELLESCIDPRAFHVVDESPYEIDAITESTYHAICSKRDDIARIAGVANQHIVIDSDIIDAYDLVWVIHVIGREPSEIAFIEWDIQLPS